MGRKPTIPMPPVELLREFLDYDPETGSLKWQRRDVRHFDSLRACESWNGHYAGHEVGWINANGYLATHFNHTNYLVQRLIWTLVTGEEPPEQIDHIDGNRTNNQWRNFRAVTQNESSKNRGLNKNNTSGFRGVQRRGKRYIAMIRNGGNPIYLGTFDTAEAASEEYERKAKEFRADFYRKR